MIHPTKRLAASLVVLLAGGCSLFRPAKQQVIIETTPTGVPVYIDGEPRGVSPVTVDLQRNTGHTIMASTQGSVYTQALEPKLSATGALDIVGAAVILVPGVGLLAPGAYDLNTRHVTLHLDQRPPETTQPVTQPLDR